MFQAHIKIFKYFTLSMKALDRTKVDFKSGISIFMESHHLNFQKSYNK